MNFFRIAIQGLLLVSILFMVQDREEGPVLGIFWIVAALGWIWLAFDHLKDLSSLGNLVIAALDLVMAITYLLRGRRAILGISGRRRRR